MRFKFSKKAGIFAFLGIVAASAITGYMLDNSGNHYFEISKISQGKEKTDAPLEKADMHQEQVSAEVTVSSEAPAADAAPINDNGKININTADAAALEALDGIGPSLAERIIKYREAHGGFDSIEELVNVSGVGKKKLDAIRGDICTE